MRWRPLSRGRTVSDDDYTQYLDALLKAAIEGSDEALWKFLAEVRIVLKYKATMYLRDQRDDEGKDGRFDAGAGKQSLPLSKVFGTARQARKATKRRPEAGPPAPAHRHKGDKASRKRMATVGTAYTVDRYLRTPEQVLAALFRDGDRRPRSVDLPTPPGQAGSGPAYRWTMVWTRCPAWTLSIRGWPIRWTTKSGIRAAEGNAARHASNGANQDFLNSITSPCPSTLWDLCA